MSITSTTAPARRRTPAALLGFLTVLSLLLGSWISVPAALADPAQEETVDEAGEENRYPEYTNPSLLAALDASAGTLAYNPYVWRLSGDTKTTYLGVNYNDGQGLYGVCSGDQHWGPYSAGGPNYVYPTVERIDAGNPYIPRATSQGPASAYAINGSKTGRVAYLLNTYAKAASTNGTDGMALHYAIASLSDGGVHNSHTKASAAVKNKAAWYLEDARKYATPVLQKPTMVDNGGGKITVKKIPNMLSPTGYSVWGYPWKAEITGGNAVWDRTGTKTVSGTTSENPGDLTITAKSSGSVSIKVTVNNVPRDSFRLYRSPKAQDLFIENGRKSVEQTATINVNLAFTPTISTQVGSASVNAGQNTVTDNVSVGLASGSPAWPSGVTVKAVGTLYGPYATKPSTSGTVPGGAPVAGSATLDFTGPGTKKASYSGNLAPGYYAWVWSIKKADQNAAGAAALAKDVTDSFFAGSETFQSQAFLPAISSQVPESFYTSSGGARPYSDKVTVSTAQGAWPSGQSLKLTGKLYGPYTTKPATSASVPSGAPVVTTLTKSVTGPGTYSYDSGDLALSAGYYAWVWSAPRADQSAAVQALMAGDVSDSFFSPSETFEVTASEFTPSVTTSAPAECVFDGLPSCTDTVEVKIPDGQQWPQSSSGNNLALTLGYQIYGPFDSPQESADAVPPGAPIYASGTHTVGGPGSHTGLAEIISDDSRDYVTPGWYTWVWSIEQSRQSPEMRQHLSQDFFDGYFLENESVIIYYPAHDRDTDISSSASPKMISQGQSLTDVVTVQVGGYFSSDTLIPDVYPLSARVIHLDGVLYGPYQTKPAASDSVPTGAPVAAVTSTQVKLEYGVVNHGDFSYGGSATVTYAPGVSEPGYYAWVWSVDASKQNPLMQKLFSSVSGGVLSDRFFSPTEVHYLPEPVALEVSTQVEGEQIEAGERACDEVSFSVANGEWDSSFGPVTASGTLYGPYDSPQQGADPDPSKAATTKTVSISGPGVSESVCMEPGPTDPGFYAWVWEIKKSDQNEALKDMLFGDVKDEFFTPTETFQVREPLKTFAVDLSSDVPEDVVVAGAMFKDTVTLELADGTWPKGSDGQPLPVVATGTVYGPYDTIQPTSPTVPAGAPVADVVTQVFTGPGAQSVWSNEVSEDLGYYAWVWTIDPAAQSEQLQPYLERGAFDAFFDPNEVQRVEADSFYPEITSAVPQPTLGLGGVFEDSVTLTLPGDDGFNLPQVWAHVEGQPVPLVVRGDLYGPFETMQEMGKDVPAGAPRVLLPDSGSPGAFPRQEGGSILTQFTSEGTQQVSAQGVRVTQSGFYAWVWSVNREDQPQEYRKYLAREVSDFFFADGEVIEVEPSTFVPQIASVVGASQVRPGAELTDSVTVSLPDGVEWAEHEGVPVSLIMDGTLYGPFPDRLEPSTTVPQGAPVAATTSIEVDHVGTYTASVTPDPDLAQGYYAWVWSIDREAQSDTAKTYLPTSVQDDFFAPTEVVEVISNPFLPSISSQVANDRIGIGDVPVDTVTIGLAQGTWATVGEDPLPVTVSGVLYGPYAPGSKPDVSQTIPAGAPIAATTSFVATGPGDYEVTDPDITVDDGGWYAWVWSINKDQSPDVALYLIDSVSDAFFASTETIYVDPAPFSLQITTTVAADELLVGESFTDQVTLTLTEGAWPVGPDGTAQPVRARGTLYGPFDQAQPTSQTVPAGSPVSGEVSEVVFTAEGTQSVDLPAYTAREGHYAWVWQVLAQDQEDLTGALLSEDVTDAFFAATESVSVTQPRFLPQISSQVGQEEVITGTRLSDTVSVTLPDDVEWGTHLDGSPVELVMDGVLYGPYDTRQDPAQVPPADAPVAYTTSITLTGPGDHSVTAPADVTDLGYYAWVWTIDPVRQSDVSRPFLSGAVSDAFFAPTEITRVVDAPFGVEIASQVEQEAVMAGDELTDTVAISLTGSDTWASEAGQPVELRVDGVLYGPYTEPQATGSQIPAGAPVAATASHTVTGPGSFSFTAPEGTSEVAGYYAWVWSVDKDSQSETARKYLRESASDAFFAPTETVKVRPWFDLEITSQVPLEQIVPASVFSDSVTLSLAQDAEWVEDDDGEPLPVVLTGTLYGPYDQPQETSPDVPSGAVAVGATKVTFTEPGTQQVDLPGVTASQVGYYAWVWSAVRSEQAPATAQHMASDVSDAFFASTEVVEVIPFEPVTPSMPLLGGRSQQAFAVAGLAAMLASAIAAGAWSRRRRTT